MVGCLSGYRGGCYDDVAMVIPETAVRVVMAMVGISGWNGSDGGGGESGDQGRNHRSF